MQLNFIPFLAEAIAANPKIHNLVESIYKKDKYKYYRLAQNSEWYTHRIITSGSIQHESISKRALGIIEDNNPDILNKILKQGWPHIYKWTRGQNEYKMAEFLAFLQKTYGSGIDKLSTDAFNGQILVSFLLAQGLGLQYDASEKGLLSFFDLIQLRQSTYYDQVVFSWENLSKEERAQARRAKKAFYSRFGFTKHWASFYIPPSSSGQPEHPYMATQSIAEYILDACDISGNVIEEQVITERDMDILVAAYLQRYDFPDIPGEDELHDLGQHIIANYPYYAIVKAYKDLKSYYWQNNSETMYFEIEALQKERDQAIEKYRHMEVQLKAGQAEIQSLNKQIKAGHYEATSSLNRLLKEEQIQNEALLAHNNALQDEIQEFKEIIASLVVDEHIVPCDLTKYRGVIAGGHQNWHSGIRELLPDNWRIIHPDSLSDNIALSGIDVVLFFVDYCNHATYYRFKSAANKQQIPIGYIYRVNKEESIREIQAITARLTTD